MPAKTPLLYRSRHGVFYLRVCLTHTERQHTNKKEVWRSLKTKDAKTARNLALRFALERNQSMSSLKNILDRTLSPYKLDLERGIMEAADAADHERMMEAAALIKERKQSDLTDEQKIRAQSMKYAAEMLQRERDSHQEFLRQERENAQLRQQLNTKPSSLTFKKYAQDYLVLIKNSTLTERTKKAYAAKLEVFEDFIGKSAKLHDITPEKFLNFQTWLAKGDPATGRAAITPRSIDEYANVISNVYKKIIKKEAENPIEGRLVSKKQRMKSNRKPFTPDELTRIFDPVRMQTCDPADFFFPILGLLTGSRPSSICQLRLGDVRREDGLMVISYHDYLEGNSAKTSATNRIVPVHPLLEQVGFYRYLDDVRQLEGSNATTLIFPWLNRYEQGFADVPTQNFREVLKRLKIYVKNVKVPYSLRHTTNQRMKERGVPEDFRSQYLGHENDSVNNITYGGITPPKFLLEKAIPYLMFEEVNWPDIHYESNLPALKRMVAVAVKRDSKKTEIANR
jgi:integrase